MNIYVYKFYQCIFRTKAKRFSTIFGSEIEAFCLIFADGMVFGAMIFFSVVVFSSISISPLTHFSINHKLHSRAYGTFCFQRSGPALDV